MENGTIGLAISILVAVITISKFFLSILTRKADEDDKFVRASTLSVIKKDIIDIENKQEIHSTKLSDLQAQSAVLSSQMGAQLRELEKLSDKFDELEE